MRNILLLFVLCCAILCMGASKHSQNNEEHLASILYVETLGESDYGKNLVATVIWVRAKGNTNDIRRVCELPKQFAKPQKNNDPEWNKCFEIAKRMYQGKFRSVYIINHKGDAVMPDHFYVYGWPTPFWARGQFHRRVGKLVFLNLGKFRTE